MKTFVAFKDMHGNLLAVSESMSSTIPREGETLYLFDKKYTITAITWKMKRGRSEGGARSYKVRSPVNSEITEVNYHDAQVTIELW